MPLDTSQDVVDPNCSVRIYNNALKSGKLTFGISSKNYDLLVLYLKDLSRGRNLKTKSRVGYSRLNAVRASFGTFTRAAEAEWPGLVISNMTEDQAHELFENFRNDKYPKRNGKPLRDIGTIARDFKSFWNWWVRSNRRSGKKMENIVEFLDTRRGYKPSFNYFTFDQLRQMTEHSKFWYKVFMWFLFDSGIRAPTEACNVRVSDLEWDDVAKEYLLNIRNETAKTFGRKIRLLLCNDLLRRYIQESQLSGEDYVFQFTRNSVNTQLSRLGKRLFGFGVESKNGPNTTHDATWISGGLTMYDFRHSSACYWVVKYKSEQALKYRFGWKKSGMITYYTEFLGMRDTIHQDDLIDTDAKARLEKELERQKFTNNVLETEVSQMRSEMLEMRKAILGLVSEKHLGRVESKSA